MLYCDQKKNLIALMITLTWSPWNMIFFKIFMMIENNLKTFKPHIFHQMTKY
jgi:hypothetical protein